MVINYKHIHMDQYKIRNLEINDIHKNIINLLNQLTSTSKVSLIDFTSFVESLHENHQVLVIEDNNKIIGMGSVFIERKIIHNMGLLGHIEDIVIDINYRNKNLGRLLLTKLKEICQEKKCYKIVLHCHDNNIGFYQKNGFIKNGNQMSLSLGILLE